MCVIEKETVGEKTKATQPNPNPDQWQFLRFPYGISIAAVALMCSYIFEEAQVIYSIVNLQYILGYYVNRFQNYVITPSGTTVDYKNECSHMWHHPIVNIWASLKDGVASYGQFHLLSFIV